MKPVEPPGAHTERILVSEAKDWSKAALYKEIQGLRGSVVDAEQELRDAEARIDTLEALQAQYQSRIAFLENEAAEQFARIAELEALAAGGA